MKRRLLAIAALLSALPASGGEVPPDPAVVEALTSIDALPTPVLVDAAFQSGSGSDGLSGLAALAADSTIDLGVQLRAIRTLPLYCPQPDASCAGTTIHDTLLALVQGYVASLRQTPPATLTPQDLLRLRAAVEALGATRSGLASDVDVLTQEPQALLRHASRDVRFAVVRALRDLRSCAAVAPLQMLTMVEPTGSQVYLAVISALQSLQAAGLMCP